MNVRKDRKEKCRESNSGHPAHSQVTTLTVTPLILQLKLFLFLYLEFIFRRCQCVHPCTQHISEFERVWKEAVVALFEV